jgi:cyclophilin family peptidyl-prolyl cis-trans isomerase
VLMTRLMTRLAGVTACLIVAGFSAAPVLASSVTLQTALGEVEIDLFEVETSQTVANFLNYVNDGDYANTFIHRSMPGFVIQGGGFAFIDGAVEPVPTDPPVVNEPGISNLRGTIAMAKLGDDPNSATSQWFINLDDNSENLDAQNGGFTVFGQVTSGMDVVDAIAALPVWNAGSTFNELPMIDYPGNPTPITEEYLVMTDISEDGVESGFAITAGMNDAWYDIETNGQGFYIVVYPNLEVMSVAWFTFDTERPDESASAMLGGPGQRWLTAQGSFTGNRAELTIYSTEGGVFDSGEPAPASREDGTMVVEFTDCTLGSVTFDIPSVDRQGVIPIQRLATDNVAMCEQLSGIPTE